MGIVVNSTVACTSMRYYRRPAADAAGLRTNFLANTMKTLQQIFDHVAIALLTQGRRSSSDGHNCVYRAPNGDKCAAGHLLKDHLYDPAFEKRRVPMPFSGMCPEIAHFVNAFTLSEVNLWDADVQSLVAELQTLHDSGSPTTWRTRLLDVAATSQLDPVAVLNFQPNHDTNHQ